LRYQGYTVWGGKMGMSESFRDSERLTPAIQEEVVVPAEAKKIQPRPEMEDCKHGMYPADCDYCNKEDQLKVYVTEGTRPGKSFHRIGDCSALKDGQLNTWNVGAIKRIPITKAAEIARACKTCW